MNSAIRKRISMTLLSIFAIVLVHTTMCDAGVIVDRSKSVATTKKMMDAKVGGEQRLASTTVRPVDGGDSVAHGATAEDAGEAISEAVGDTGFRLPLLVGILNNRDLRFDKEVPPTKVQHYEERGNERTTRTPKKTDSLRVLPEKANKNAKLEMNKAPTSQPNSNKQMGKFRTWKDKSLKSGRRNVYQLRGSDGDKGSVKFVKKVSEPVTGTKEINWIIKIRQVVLGNFDNGVNEEEAQNSPGEKNDNLAQIEEEMRKLWAKDNEFNQRTGSGGKLNQRHLLQFRGKGGSDEMGLKKEQFDDKGDASVNPLASSISDIEQGFQKNSDNVPLTLQSALPLDAPVKKGAEGPDATEIESIKKKLSDGGISFLLGRDKGNGNDDAGSDGKGLDQNSNIDQQLEEVVSRLQNVYSDYPRQRRAVDKENGDKDYDYGINDDNSSDKDAKIGDLIQNGEMDKEFIAGMQGIKMNKRDVQDVSGRYGVSVSEDDDGNPKEYDTEIDNGVKQDLMPREAQIEQRDRRQADSSHSTGTSVGSEHGSHDTHHDSGHLNGARSTSGSDATQHTGTHTNDHPGSHENGKIIGVGYILFNTDGSVKDVIHAGLAHAHHGYPGHGTSHPHHHGWPCNKTQGHGDGAHRHPCHDGHRRHHHHGGSDKAEHHVAGRTEGHSGEGSHQPHGEGHPLSGDQLFQKALHEKQFLESHPHDDHHHDGNFRSEHGSEHHSQGTGGMVVVESYRTGRLSDGRNQQAAAATPTSGMHVLVILSIILICFTVVLFFIVRNRSSHHIREMNSRTALFVPQAKY